MEFLNKANNHNSCHHELKSDEIWVGNANVSKGLSIPDHLIGKLKTVRLGEQAYDIKGEPISRNYYRPLIINKSEEVIYNQIMMQRMSSLK